MQVSNLQPLFQPNGIAVVGASTDPAKLGSVILRNIIDAGYKGKVFPTNPKYELIEDLTTYPTVSQVPEQVDLVVIVIPAQFVLETVKDCAAKGVKFCVVISAGFGEVGEEGRELERQLVEAAAPSGMRILGPNCLGLTVPEYNLDASFAATVPSVGNIAFLSQSGAFNTAMLDMAAEQRLGFSHFVSMGNKSDLNELDFMRAWIEDPQVEVIGMYIEEFQDGRELVQLIASTSKPVVILHPGESKEAQQAIASHTGSLAGSVEVIHAALAKAGALQVDSSEKLFNLLKGLAWTKKLAGDKTVVLTNAGGPGIMITDMIVANKIALPELSPELQSQIGAVLPPAASKHNPVDLIGDALAERYKQVLEIINDSSEVDTVVALLTPQHVTQIEETSKVLINYHQTGNKPLIVIYLGGERVGPGLDLLYDAKVPAFNFAEEGIFVLGKLRQYSKYRELYKNPVMEVEPAMDSLASIATPELKALSQDLVHQITADLPFDLPVEQTISSFQQAINFTSEHGFPVVLKASTVDIAHKTEEKALRLNLDSADKLETAFTELREIVSKATGNPEPELLIQQQVEAGEELIIGINRDGGSDVYSETGTGFGHLILVGKGGIYTEVYKDIAYGLVPLTRDQLLDLVLQTNVSKILVGSRNMEGLAIEKLIDALDAAQKLVMRHPEIAEFDINPAIITKDRCYAVDIKVFVQK